jgi:hypothetical protein
MEGSFMNIYGNEREITMFLILTVENMHCNTCRKK